MEKLIELDTKNDRGVFLYTIGEGRDGAFLEKTASSSFHPEIADYITRAKPYPNKIQILLTALGAGPIWGSNRNGDYFTEEGLKNTGGDYGHKTFELYAKCYKHHVNKDRKKSYGDVLLSVWHDKMKRVELICTLDRDKAPDLIEKIENGEYLPVSMGTKVPFDVCSICGNKAKTRAQYCDHLRYSMNKIPPGHSKKAYAVNTMPKFFDISFVFIGADSTARVLKKVASLDGHHKNAERKIAEIRKKVDSNIKPETVVPIESFKELRDVEPDMPRGVLIGMGRENPGMSGISKVLSSLFHMGIVPKPREFQDIALNSLGKGRLADYYSDKGVVFDPFMDVPEKVQCGCDQGLGISHRLVDDNILQKASPFIENKSYLKPFLTKRITILIKKANVDESPTVLQLSSDDRKKIGLLPMMLGLTGLYAAFSKKVPKDSIKSIDNAIKGNRKLGLLLAATTGVGLGVNAMAQHTRENAFGKYDLGPPPGDYEDYKHTIRQKNMVPLTKQAYLKRIVFGVPAIYAASGVQEMRMAKNPYQKEGRIGKIIRKYPDLLSVGLIGERMLGAPITGAPNKLYHVGRKLLKRGSLEGAALSALAFPGPSMPLRAAMFAVDEGVIKGVGKAINKLKMKKQKRSYNA